jgi:hypothetical protein
MISNRSNVIFIHSSVNHELLFSKVIESLAEKNECNLYKIHLRSRTNDILDKNLSHKNTIQELYYTLHEFDKKHFLDRVILASFLYSKIFNQIIMDIDPKIVILANDTGHIERLIIRICKKQNIKTLLVQDGYLTNYFPQNLFGSVMHNLTCFWILVGGGHIGLIPYGMGGCDYIAAHGEVWADILHYFKVKSTKSVFITGHPNLPISISLPIKSKKPVEVIYLCTNYISGLKDTSAHTMQINEILAIKTALENYFRGNALLRVKLHPQDNIADYKSIIGIDGLRLHHSETLSALISNASLCITNISSSYLECIYYGRICILSRIGLKSPYKGLFSKLPGDKVHSVDQLENYFELFNNAELYAKILERQKKELLNWIDDPSQANRKLQDLILEII